MLATKLQQRAGVRPFGPARTRCVMVQAKVSLSGLVTDIAKSQLKASPTGGCTVGDNVKVGLGVMETGGKTRTQTLDGIIIGEHGSGTDKTMTFRRVFQGVGVEMVIPVHSPVLQRVEFVKRGKVRRAKLYFLRERMGKSARLKEVVGAKYDNEELKAAQAAQAPAKK